jgi:hypothetical protein
MLRRILLFAVCDLSKRLQVITSAGSVKIIHGVNLEALQTEALQSNTSKTTTFLLLRKHDKSLYILLSEIRGHWEIPRYFTFRLALQPLAPHLQKWSSVVAGGIHHTYN